MLFLLFPAQLGLMGHSAGQYATSAVMANVGLQWWVNTKLCCKGVPRGGVVGGGGGLGNCIAIGCSLHPQALNSNHLRTMVSSHPWGNIPKMTVPLPPPPVDGTERTRDMKQNMRTPGHMNHKKTQKLPVAMHVQLY